MIKCTLNQDMKWCSLHGTQTKLMTWMPLNNHIIRISNFLAELRILCLIWNVSCAIVKQWHNLDASWVLTTTRNRECKRRSRAWPPRTANRRIGSMIAQPPRNSPNPVFNAGTFIPSSATMLMKAHRALHKYWARALPHCGESTLHALTRM